MKGKIVFVSALALLLLVSGIIAQDLDLDRQERIEFGHVILIDKINTDPVTLSPGNPAELQVIIRNGADISVKDVRIDLSLPGDIGFYNDFSRRKIFSMAPKSSNLIKFNVVPHPSAADGIYNGIITINYLSKTGEERSDIYNFSLTIKSDPKIYATIEESSLYAGQNVGDITIKFVNEGLGDVKFLTAQVEETSDFESITSKKEYIGDLDSDDFESVSFTIKKTTLKNEIMIPVKIYYKDSLNQDFEESFNLELKIRDAKELGNGNGYTIYYVIGGGVVVIILFLFYRSRKKRRRKDKGK